MPIWRRCAVNRPQPWLDHLAATVAARQIIALAELAPGLTDTQPAARLMALAGRLP